MRKILLGIFLFFLVLVGLYFFLQREEMQNKQTAGTTTTQIPAVSTIAQNLDTPWGIVFLSDKSMLVTERRGMVRFISASGKLDDTPIAQIKNVKEIGEGGLLGIALHPDFAKNNFLYLYYTYDNQNGNTKNRVVRMVYKDKKFSNEKIILDAIPGASNHNGGRIKFGPDGYLYVTTGDAQEPSQAQDTKSLAGKILRITDAGKAAPGNPFTNAVYSYGHRNPQGIAWDTQGQLWSTEHGRSGALSGLDEVNRIEKGANYGWPTIEGNKKQAGMKTPIGNSGDFSTWAPGGAAISGENLYFGGLRGSALYKGTMQNGTVSIQEYFKDVYGRIRDVVLGPDGLLYISTSNLDGRGVPKPQDDKILRIDPKQL